MNGNDAVANLPEPWRAALDQAWQSWQARNFGIGAVLADPDTGEIVSAGRNRVAQATSDPGLLSGNMTAHAEMNAFAALDRFNAEGLHLYTTLEPCLMCAATAMQLKVSHVHIAVMDEYFDDLDSVWRAHPVTSDRMPERTLSFTGESARLGAFARMLPMAFTIEHFSGRSAEEIARAEHPAIAELIDELNATGELERLRQRASVEEAIAELWDRLPG